MKNYLALTLFLLIFTSCSEEANFDSESNTEFKNESRILFSSSKFEELSSTYPYMDKSLMDQSLEERTIDGSVVYSMELNNEGVDLRQLFFKIDNGELINALIIENSIVEDKNEVYYNIRTTNNDFITELDLVKVNDVRMFRQQAEIDGFCYFDCLASYTQQCIDDGYIVITGCIIAGNFIAAACILHCL